MVPGANAVTDAGRFHQRAQQKSFHSFQTVLLKLTKTPAIEKWSWSMQKGQNCGQILEIAHALVTFSPCTPLPLLFFLHLFILLPRLLGFVLI